MCVSVPSQELVCWKNNCSRVKGKEGLKKNQVTTVVGFLKDKYEILRKSLQIGIKSKSTKQLKIYWPAITRLAFMMERSIFWFGPFKLAAAWQLGYSLPGTPKIKCVRSLTIFEPWSPNTYILSKLSESLNPFVSGLIMLLASEKRNCKNFLMASEKTSQTHTSSGQTTI